MGKQTTMVDFFKRKNAQISKANVGDALLPTPRVDIPTFENPPTKSRKVDVNEIDISSLEHDPGSRPQILDYDVNRRDEIRRAYIKAGPYQPTLSKYPRSGSASHLRRFRPSWFKLFPSWLEYSRDKDAAFCLPCFLFYKPSGNPTHNAFTVYGFKNWKKVNGKDCAFLTHIGKNPNSRHRIAERSYNDLRNQSQSFQKEFGNANN
ncbi:uncharacterized protein LOC132186133 [Corylus avellana]|uniref:uncharacterized protein LOC132186133 n=1 Tax=Corylus avellana TaxID=13451 RepID=UPI00286B5F07|nr:uncharacterized protein LOC132186133 [Corylus avellana]